jgi:hypothetical protein
MREFFKTRQADFRRMAFFCFLFFCGFNARLGAADNGGQNPAAYLTLGVGGETSAMGGAAAGLRGDLTGAFYNPAGIAGIDGTEVEFERTSLSLDRSIGYFAVGSNYEKAYYFAISLIGYSVDNLEARSGPSVTPDDIFSDLNLAFMTSIAFPLGSDLDFGFNLKIFIQAYTLAELPTGFGLGEDLGIQYHPGDDTVWGLTAQDPFSDFIYSDSTDALFPRVFRGGVSKTLKDIGLKMNLDVEWHSDLGLVPRAGLEWRPVDALAFRGGYWIEANSGEDGFGTGVGLFIQGTAMTAEFDYTLAPDLLINGGLLQQISLSGNFL